MVFNPSIALNWILYLALLPMAFFWLRRAWRIAVRRDYSEVALKRGEPPANPARWARWQLLIDGTAGLVAATVFVLVPLLGLPFETWTALAGSTVICKIFLDFALSRQAHGLAAKPRA
ncbi:MAG: hypothetical protein KF863_03745 [Rubrivivax sp.]|nr:hypothetical protein [Rubrivivax sp.]